MLKSTLIKTRGSKTCPARPKLTVINSPAPAAGNDAVSVNTIVDKLAKIGVKDILIVEDKHISVHKLK